MTRGTDTDLLDELRSVDPKPIVLVEIQTGYAPTPYLRYTSNDVDLTWPTGDAGNTFEARPLEVAALTIDGSEAPGVEVTIGDVDLELDTWLASVDFRGKKLKRYLVERDELGDTDLAILDVLRISHREQTAFGIRFTAEPLRALLQRIEYPRDVMTREEYPGMLTEGLVR